MTTVVLSAFNVAGFPEGGGHFWVYLQYVLGLRQLGCEVYWLESFLTKDRAEREAAALATFRARMEQFGLGRQHILYLSRIQEANGSAPTEFLNATKAEAEAVFEKADLLLNFHYAINPRLLARFRRTALVDIDPGLLQFWISRGQLQVPRHDRYFTTGETVGCRGSRIPDTGLPWRHMRPPVCLDHWPVVFDPRSEAFTTISNWDSSDWVVDRGDSYENTKRVAFLEFANLPQLTSQKLELALFLRWDRDLAEQRDLERRGWRIRNSRDVTVTPESYQRYIQASRGEFSCAKRSCMKFQNAWVSDRTLCYLASGKPAVVQDTGPSAWLPDGEGMFRFSTSAEAARAFEIVNRDYEKHCRAARQIVENLFDARQVLKGVLEQALS